MTDNIVNFGRRRLSKFVLDLDVTDLRQSAQPYRTATRQARTVFWQWSLAEGRLTHWSDEYESTGSSGADGDMLKTIHADDRERVQRVYDKAYDDECKFEVDYRVVDADGGERWLHERAEVNFDESGKAIAFTGILQDITDSKNTEEALRASEARYKEASNIANLGHWAYDEVADRSLFCSDELARIHGVTPGAYVAMVNSTENDIERIHPDDRETYGKVLKEAQKNATPYSVEYRIYRPDGEIRYIREMGDPVLDNTGKLIQSRGTLQDVTGSKLAEESLKKQNVLLRAAEDRFQQAERITRSTNWETDTQLRTATYISTNAEAVFGLRPESYIGDLALFERDILPEDLRKIRKVFEALPADPRPYQVEFRYKREDGRQIWLREVGEPIFDAAGTHTGFRGTTQDITDSKKAEEALRKSEAQFRDYAETAADYFWEMDSDLKYSRFEGRYEEVTGVAPESAIGKSREELWAEGVPSFAGDTAPFPDVAARRPFANVEHQWVNPNGNTRTLSISGKPIFDEDGVFLGYRGSGRDITETHSLAEKLSYQATHDALTGLFSRHEFERRLARVLETARSSHDEHALCYLDLDQFKVVNDTCGHAAGDELLRQLGQLLSATVRKRDTLARLGGDEFGVLMEHCTLTQAHRAANKMRRAVAEFRFVWEEQAFHIGVSIGLVPISEASESIANILIAADSACYAAKDEGRNRIHVYHLDDTELARRHGEMQWVARINRALEENRFELWSQSIVPIQSETHAGEHFELLLRLVDEQGDTVPPGAFLPAAERYGLSTKLDRWVVGTAFDWLSRNPGLLERLHLCCINLSGTSLADEQFLAFVQQQFEQLRIPAQKICFEVTETAAIAKLSRAVTFMNTLKQRGCLFALDDFGSGLSSFAYLKTLPVDYLKIDGAFVKDIVDDEVDLALVRSINDVGKVMGKLTVAEFVESEAILEKLREIGVDYAQGYGISLPARIEESDSTGISVSYDT